MSGWTTGSPACSVFLKQSLMRATLKQSLLWTRTLLPVSKVKRASVCLCQYQLVWVNVVWITIVFVRSTGLWAHWRASGGDFWRKVKRLRSLIICLMFVCRMCVNLCVIVYVVKKTLHWILMIKVAGRFWGSYCIWPCMTILHWCHEPFTSSSDTSASGRRSYRPLSRYSFIHPFIHPCQDSVLHSFCFVL